MSWESDERKRDEIRAVVIEKLADQRAAEVRLLNDLVRERNRLLRERSKLRATLRYLIGYIEKRNPAAVVGHRIKTLAKAGRR